MEGKEIPSALNERQKFLLQIIQNLIENYKENPVSHLLHESILLCRIEKGDIDIPLLGNYNFRAYIRGPFSEELREDLRSLKEQGFLDIKQGMFVPTEKGSEFLKSFGYDPSLKRAEEVSNAIFKKFPSTHSITRRVVDSRLVKCASFGNLIDLSESRTP